MADRILDLIFPFRRAWIRGCTVRVPSAEGVMFPGSVWTKERADAFDRTMEQIVRKEVPDGR